MKRHGPEGRIVPNEREDLLFCDSSRLFPCRGGAFIADRLGMGVRYRRLERAYVGQLDRRGRYERACLFRVQLQPKESLTILAHTLL